MFYTARDRYGNLHILLCSIRGSYSVSRFRAVVRFAFVIVPDTNGGNVLKLVLK